MAFKFDKFIDYEGILNEEKSSKIILQPELVKLYPETLSKIKQWMTNFLIEFPERNVLKIPGKLDEILKQIKRLSFYPDFLGDTMEGITNYVEYSGIEVEKSFASKSKKDVISQYPSVFDYSPYQGILTSCLHIGALYYVEGLSNCNAFWAGANLGNSVKGYFVTNDKKKVSLVISNHTPSEVYEHKKIDDVSKASIELVFENLENTEEVLKTKNFKFELI